jgi:hypothetical protein
MEWDRMGMMQQFYNKTQVVIDSVHEEVHEGKFFSGGYYNSSVANNAAIDLLVQSSSAHYTHVKMRVAGGGDMTVQIYENATFSSAGTSVTMTNHNRASSKSFSGTVTHTPTITGTGSQINGTSYIPGGPSGGGAGSAHAGSDFSYNNEFILDKSKNYLFRITNVSGGAIKMSAAIEGYINTL